MFEEARELNEKDKKIAELEKRIQAEDEETAQYKRRCGVVEGGDPKKAEDAKEKRESSLTAEQGLKKVMTAAAEAAAEAREASGSHWTTKPEPPKPPRKPGASPEGRADNKKRRSGEQERALGVRMLKKRAPLEVAYRVLQEFVLAFAPKESYVRAMTPNGSEPWTTSVEYSNKYMLE